MKKKNRQRASLNQETFVIFMVVCCGIVATLSFAIFDNPDPESSVQGDVRIPSPALPTDQTTQVVVSPSTVPLSTGDEPIDQLFVQSGCAVCHTIPGIEAAKGREGPRLELSVNGPQRLAEFPADSLNGPIRPRLSSPLCGPHPHLGRRPKHPHALGVGQHPGRCRRPPAPHPRISPNKRGRASGLFLYIL